MKSIFDNGDLKRKGKQNTCRLQSNGQGLGREARIQNWDYHQAKFTKQHQYGFISKTEHYTPAVTDNDTCKTANI